MSNCDCINQGFLCREYWRNCPKCSGTGTVVPSVLLYQALYQGDKIALTGDRLLFISDENRGVIAARSYSNCLNKVYNWLGAGYDDVRYLKGAAFVGDIVFCYQPSQEDLMAAVIVTRHNSIPSLNRRIYVIYDHKWEPAIVYS